LIQGEGEEYYEGEDDGEEYAEYTEEELAEL
jgi:hypothetical protein